MPHFEIHVTDVEAAKAFYGGLLGWSFEPMQGAEDVGYHLATGPGVGGEQSLSVGVLQRPGAAPEPGSPVRGGTLTCDVADCDTSYHWALAHGGAEALPPETYPGIGRCAYVEDGQGNIVGIISPEEGSA
jgi:predicted enzyme related to lactoylglutathione lyase